MLLFIHMPRRAWRYFPAFQYISCYCLSLPVQPDDNACVLFQYISCYCLSVTITQIAKDYGNFNTSHVTVYPLVQAARYSSVLFQYISCYCLSIRHMEKQKKHIYFNTSHVTVYLIKEMKYTQWLEYFNTSHVTVYLLCFPDNLLQQIFQYISCYCLSVIHLCIVRQLHISIHLMLLFIAVDLLSHL